MPDMKSQMKYKVFLGVVFLFGGIVSILGLPPFIVPLYIRVSSVN
jgi:hypothetical protein